MKQPRNPPERKKLDIFTDIEWYAVKIAGTIVFLSFVYGEVARAVARIFAK
jgi:hypothetical protein